MHVISCDELGDGVELGQLGKRLLVLKLSHQYYLRSTRDVATAVGTKIP